MVRRGIWIVVIKAFTLNINSEELAVARRGSIVDSSVDPATPVFKVADSLSAVDLGQGH